MTQQGSLFAPQPPPLGEGRWGIAVEHGQAWRVFSRDHRWVEPGLANAWAKAHLHEFMGQQWRVVLVEEFNKV